jgi:hypothetical protein
MLSNDAEVWEVVRYQHFNFLKKRLNLDPSGRGDKSFSSDGGSGSNGCVRAVELGKLGLMPCSRFLRASTTLRTSTVRYTLASCMVMPAIRVTHTRKSLLYVHHLSGARFHKPVSSTPRPFQALSGSYLPQALQIAFVTRDNAYRQGLTPLHSCFPLHVNE